MPLPGGLDDAEGLLDALSGSVATLGARLRHDDLNLRELGRDRDPHRLDSAGWGIIWGRETRAAVGPLLDDFLHWREGQADKLFYQEEFAGRLAEGFLWKSIRDSPGVIDPERLPYYLLLVGSPEEIPFHVQHKLAINRAVGRLYFKDPQDYVRYTNTVRRLEEWPWQASTLPQRVDFFSAETDDTSRLLARRLIDQTAPFLAEKTPWETRSRRGPEATRENFLNLLAADPSGMLIASSHGKPIGYGGEAQEAVQGALICEGGELLRAADIEQRWPVGELPFAGLIAGLFACYSAGTPGWDNFPDVVERSEKPSRIALTEQPEGFVASLPQALLARGAAAVIGHVDRGWTSSFEWRLLKQKSTATRSLNDSLYSLLMGHRLGHALRPLFRRSQHLAAHVLPILEACEAEEMDPNGSLANELLLNLRVAYADARNYIIQGDPAVYAAGCVEKKPVDSEEERQARQLWPAYLDATLLAKVRQQVSPQEFRPWLEQAIQQKLDWDDSGGAAFYGRGFSPEDSREGPGAIPRPSSIASHALRLDSVSAAFDFPATAAEQQRLHEALAGSALLHAPGDREAPTFHLHHLPSERWPNSRHLLSGWVLSEGDALLAPVRKAGESLDPLGDALTDLKIAAQRRLLFTLGDRLSPDWLDVQLRQRGPEGWQPLQPGPEPSIEDGRELAINLYNRSDQRLHLRVWNLGCGGGPPVCLLPQPGEASLLESGESWSLDQLQPHLPKSYPFHHPGRRPAAGWEEYLIFATTTPVTLGDRTTPLGRILTAILQDDVLPEKEDLGDPGWTVERKVVKVVGE
jgi:hypothetical protein